VRIHPVTTAAVPIDYRVIVAASLLLSLWLIAINPLIDRDAILYLRSADAYLQGGMAASQQLFGRPLLSVCFALIHQVTGIPLLYAGLLLNTLFYALFCVAFVAVVRALGGDRRIQLLAALVILSHPVINEQRSSIMREPGYWAFLLLAFRELLLYLRQPGWRHRLRWFGCIALAAMFRLEGLFFALLAPLALLSTASLDHHWRHCLRLLSLPLLATALLLGAWLLYPSAPGSHDYRFPGVETYIDRLRDLPQSFGEVVAATGNAMLEFSAREDAAAAVLAGLAAVAILNICRALTWPWLLTLLWGRYRGLVARFRADDRRLLQAHLLISLSYLACFTLLNRFMLERYACGFVIFALLYLPFVLNDMWAEGRRSLQRGLVILLLVVMSLDSLHKLDYQKTFIADAAEWLRTNTPDTASIASNNQYLAYFSDRDFDWPAAARKGFDLNRILADPALWRDRDYLVMRVNRANTEAWQAFLSDHSLVESAVFDGGRHGKVAIVKLADPELPDGWSTSVLDHH
jgi:hypothetical protein